MGKSSINEPNRMHLQYVGWMQAKQPDGTSVATY
jgi:hypothetical protein